MSEQIVLAGAVRTAIGSFGGSLAKTSAAELATAVVGESLRRSGIPASAVDEVIFGQALQAGAGQNVARQAAVKAGLPVTTPAVTLNQVCGSGLAAVRMAEALIASGQAEVIVVGGVESMSGAPYLLPKARFGYRLGEGQMVDSMFSEGLADSFEHYPMGVTAEKVAEKFGISRQAQDRFAFESQRKAAEASDQGLFFDEIMPVTVKSGREEVSFSVDESIRVGTSMEKLARLRPAFQDGGTVTAGNSSTINDGAAALVVLSERKARDLGVYSQAVLVGSATVGVEPELMGTGPVASTRKLLAMTGTSVEDLACVELNEAFAAQSLAVIQETGFDPAIVNPLGGAIALGHPLGCSGARILVTLLFELARTGGGLGLASLCIGGGMGISALIRSGENE